MAKSNSLTAMKVAKLTKCGRYADGNGLYLQISQWNTKAWLFRFQRGGRERHMGLGSANTLTLAEARDRALAARKLLLDGIDPIEHRKAERTARRLEETMRITFAECAEAYVKTKSLEWRNAKHDAQWRSTLKTYAYPIIGMLPVANIDTALVRKVLDPIWESKTETADRLRGRIEQVLDFASVMKMRVGDNPARWRGNLKHALAAKGKIAPVKHHPALDYAELPAFMAELRIREGVGARALEFLVLTAARTGAIIGATRDEFDLVAGVWTVAPERTGAKITGADPKPRRVPLSGRTLTILRGLPREEGNPYMFPGRFGGPLSNMAMLKIMHEMRPGFVPHGFRSTFKDWCSETTNYPNEVSEAALWHTIGDKVERAYRRGELFEKRRALMNDWADYCGSSAAVIPLPINAQQWNMRAS